MTHFKYEGYMGEKRKNLVEKYGYDCKNAAQKTGKRELKEVKEYAGKLMTEFELAQTSKLPQDVSRDKQEEILLETMKIEWENN